MKIISKQMCEISFPSKYYNCILSIDKGHSFYGIITNLTPLKLVTISPPKWLLDRTHHLSWVGGTKDMQ